MSGYLASLLAREKQTFKSTIERLEAASGQNDIDAHFTSELIIKSKIKLRNLGLDPSDTTAEELHQALINLAELHDKFLANKIGCQEEFNSLEVLSKVAKYSTSIAKRKSVWVIKHSVAKRLIKLNPPKTLMKQLGYRSIDSMIKREDVINLFAGAYTVENHDWIDNLYKIYRKLTASDFEARKLSVNYITSSKWQKFSKVFVNQKRSNVISLKELGSVVILPMSEQRFKGITILILPLVLHYINEIQIYGSYFKYEQVQSNFGQILGDVLTNGYSNYANLCGQDLHWGIIHDHFLQMIKDNEIDAVEPHMQLEDLEFESVEETLYKLEPALHFWYGNECLGTVIDSKVISFNLMDVATDYINNIAIEKSSTHYLQNSLWDELLKRYLLQPPLRHQVMQQVNSVQVEDAYNNSEVNGAVYA